MIKQFVSDELRILAEFKQTPAAMDALLVSRQAARPSWDQTRTGSIIIMTAPTIAAIVVWVLVFALPWSVAWLNGIVKVTLGCGGAIAAAAYVGRIMDSVLAEIKTKRDQELGAYFANAKALQVRIDTATSIEGATADRRFRMTNVDDARHPQIGPQLRVE